MDEIPFVSCIAAASFLKKQKAIKIIRKIHPLLFTILANILSLCAETFQPFQQSFFVCLIFSYSVVSHYKGSGKHQEERNFLTSLPCRTHRFSLWKCEEEEILFKKLFRPYEEQKKVFLSVMPTFMA